MSFDYIKTEAKRLGSLSLLIVGFFLVAEHIFTYGYISLRDILGHEWIGIILMILGLFFANKHLTKEEGTAWQLAKAKLKYIFGGGNAE